MEEELQHSLETEKYSGQIEILEIALGKINYHQEEFPESFEKRLATARKKIDTKKLGRFDLTNKLSWDFDSILANIKSYPSLGLDLITETNLMIEDSFDEAFWDDYLYRFALESLSDWITILNGRITNSRERFDYYLKEMKDSNLPFEREIAMWISEVYDDLGDLDFRYFLNLFLQNNKHMGSTILKLQQIPFSLSKYFDNSSNQIAQSRWNNANNCSTHPSQKSYE
jgi:hypothetical protein